MLHCFWIARRASACPVRSYLIVLELNGNIKCTGVGSTHLPVKLLAKSDQVFPIIKMDEAMTLGVVISQACLPVDRYVRVLLSRSWIDSYGSKQRKGLD